VSGVVHVQALIAHRIYYTDDAMAPSRPHLAVSSAGILPSRLEEQPLGQSCSAEGRESACGTTCTAITRINFSESADCLGACS